MPICPKEERVKDRKLVPVTQEWQLLREEEYRPMDVLAEEPQQPTTRWRIAPFLRPVRFGLIAIFLMMVVGIVLGLLQPYLIQVLIDQIILEAREDLLWIFGAVLLGSGLIRFAMGIVQARWYAAVTTRVLLDLRLDFLAHLQKLPLRFFAGTRFGDIITRFNRDLSQLQEIATGALLGFATQSLTLIGAVTWGLVLDPSLFLLATAPFPIAILAAAIFRLRVRRQTESLRRRSQDLAQAVTETILSMRTVRTFGRERGEEARIAGIGHRFIREVLGFQVTFALASGLPRVCLLISSITLYWVGGIAVIRGEITLGQLVALGLYLTTAFGPLGSLVELGLQVTGARVSLERVREMRELPIAEPGPSDAPNPGTVVGTIRLSRVRFRHVEDRPLLEGIDLQVEAGERVAILGRSGAGKSPLIDLLLGFLDPTEGTIEVGGHDLRAVRRDRIRDAIGVVPATTDLFYGTIADNIRFGSPRASEEEVKRAAQRAGLTEEMVRWPDGLETVVGERGLQLSAGERQRIGLARALIREPGLLILDEATSDLDPATEERILNQLAALANRPTIVAITHREELAKWADRTAVLAEGVLRVHDSQDV